MTIIQHANITLPRELNKLVLQYSETPDYKTVTQDVTDNTLFDYNYVKALMEVIKSSRENDTFNGLVEVSHDRLVKFIKNELSTRRYDLSVNSSIMKTASREIVEPFLDKLLSSKDLRRPLSPTLLDPLPTVALWGFHRYAQTRLGEYDRKFIKVTDVSLALLIEAALKQRGLDVKQLSDFDCKKPLLKVLEKEFSDLKNEKDKQYGQMPPLS